MAKKKPNHRRCGWCDKPLGTEKHAAQKYCDVGCKNRSRRVTQYNLTVSQYRELVAHAEGRCPICQRKTKVWNIDHNHETGEVYGVVCTTCNFHLLAFTWHRPEIADRLAEFLRRPPARKYGATVSPRVKHAIKRDKKRAVFRNHFS